MATLPGLSILCFAPMLHCLFHNSTVDRVLLAGRQISWGLSAEFTCRIALDLPHKAEPAALGEAVELTGSLMYPLSQV